MKKYNWTNVDGIEPVCQVKLSSTDVQVTVVFFCLFLSHDQCEKFTQKMPKMAQKRPKKGRKWLCNYETKMNNTGHCAGPIFL